MQDQNLTNQTFIYLALFSFNPMNKVQPFLLEVLMCYQLFLCTVRDMLGLVLVGFYTATQNLYLEPTFSTDRLSLTQYFSYITSQLPQPIPRGHNQY